MENIKPKLLVITGPTASGKTALAIGIAQHVRGEIVSADSMQVYRGLDIGTAKPTVVEMRGVPHHMLSVFAPAEKVTVAQYREKAVASIRDIVARGRLPIICGGTGLYIDALTKPMGFGAEEDTEQRDALRFIANEQDGRVRLYGMLKELDPGAAEKYDMNDVRRVTRAIANFRATGKTLAERAREEALLEPEFDSRLYAIEWPRETLYERINMRTVEMLRNGLVDEVHRLIREGVSVDDTSMQAIGYKEILAAIEGRAPWSGVREAIQQASRRYAKRQMTWLRRDGRIRWLAAEGQTVAQLSNNVIDDFIANGFM